MATPMLPRIAMPSAPPSSAPVSEIPEAAPARSGGADPTIRSVVAVNTGASPRETMAEAVARIARSAEPPTRVSNVGPHDQPGGRGQRPQTGLQRRQPKHELQVLRDEDEVADHDEDAKQVGRQRGVERPAPKQPEVDHRVRQAKLAPHEDHTHRQPGQE